MGDQVTEVQSLFIESLKALRRRYGLSQAMLAENCELSTNYIAQIESGRRFPSVETLQAICDFFDISPSELFCANDGRRCVEANEYGSQFKERLKNYLVREIESFV
jgi:transcriptional regulator with XRE-family HTH domain